MTTPKPSHLAPVLLAALLTPACGSFRLPGDTRGKIEEPDRDVDYMIRRGLFVDAVFEAERLQRENPDDPAAAEAYRMASAAWLLEQGRRELFANRDEEALALFLEAGEIAPEQDVIRDWIDSAHHQLALTWHDRGLAWYVGDDLEKARDCFESALEHEPGNWRARASLYRILLQMNYREGMSAEYYDEGVRAYYDLRLDEADQYFSYSRKYDPGNERAIERRELTRTELAHQRVYLAAGHESNERYAAARNEYRMALLLDDGLEEALEGYERAGREAEATDFLREAERKILRKEYQVAVETLAEGRALTVRQQEAYDAMLDRIEEARLNDRYEVARTFESDQQFEAAVAAYDVLLGEAPYFLDAIARRDTLQSYIDEAGRLYEKAMNADSEEDVQRYLRRIEVFWPDYEDVRERLE